MSSPIERKLLKKNDSRRQYFTYDLNDVHHQVDRLKEALKSF